MQSLPRCWGALLLTVSLSTATQAQYDPYGYPTRYPRTHQLPHTYPSSFDAQHAYGTRVDGPVAGEDGPVLQTPANQTAEQRQPSQIGTPPRSLRPVTPIRATPYGATPLHRYSSLEPGSGHQVRSSSRAGHGVGESVLPYAPHSSSAIAPKHQHDGKGVAGSCSACGMAGGKLSGGCSQLHDSGWFGSLGGILMTRDRQDHYMFSYERTNEANQLTDARDAEIQWGGGFEVSFGRYFNCGQNAWQAVYWGLFPDSESTFTTTDGITQLDGILNWNQLTYNGAPANASTDDAEIHALFRDNEFHNVELNLLQLFDSCASGYCSSALHYRVLAGVRYFKFRDDLLFGADTVDRQFTGAAEEIYYNIDLDNNLIGFQIGGEVDYRLGQRTALDFGVKVGLFGNHIEHLSEIGGAAGVAVINNGPNMGREFRVRNSKNDVSFLAEMNFGIDFLLSDHWTLTTGYRAVAVAGVALPTDQIYHDLRGIQDVELIASNGSLILHGGYLGLELSY